MLHLLTIDNCLLYLEEKHEKNIRYNTVAIVTKLYNDHTPVFTTCTYVELLATREQKLIDIEKPIYI